MNWKTWKEWHGGIGVLPPKPGRILGLWFQPSVLRQGPSQEQNLEQGNYWQLFLTLLYLPENGVKVSCQWSTLPHFTFYVSGKQRGCLGRACKTGGCLRSAPLRPVSTNLLCLCVSEGTPLLLPAGYGSCLLRISKPSVNPLMLSAATTSYGNNFQKFIISCKENQKYSYLSSTPKIFQFQVSSNSWGILHLSHSPKPPRSLRWHVSCSVHSKPALWWVAAGELRALLIKIQVWNSLHQTHNLKGRRPTTNPGIRI